jgi:hypothetical protein
MSQTLNRQALAKKIAGSRGSQGGNYFRDGSYLCVVLKMELSGGHKGEKFLGEYKILEASPVDVAPDLLRPRETFDMIKPNAVGSIVSKVCMLSQEMGPSNAKSMLCGIDGTPEGEVGEGSEEFIQMTLDATERHQPLRGVLVRVETYRKRKQKKQDEIMILEKWIHVEGQTAESIAKNRAALDAPASDIPF